MQTKTRLIALLLGLVLVFCLSACQKAPAETTDAPAETADFGIFPEIAGENGTTYANLFDVILSADYDGVWTNAPQSSAKTVRQRLLRISRVTSAVISMVRRLLMPIPPRNLSALTAGTSTAQRPLPSPVIPLRSR